MKRAITLTHYGWHVTGEAHLVGWLGERGTIDMTPTTIQQDTELTRDQIVACVNDGNYGAEAIDAAFVNVSQVYSDENGYPILTVGWEEYQFKDYDLVNAKRGV